MKHLLPLALTLLFVPAAQAVELVKNGGFETGPQYNADFWTKPDLGTAPDGEPANYARVGNWVNQAGTDPYGYSYGPHGAGNGTGTQIPTRTAWLGGLNPRTSIIQQQIDTSAFANGAASLTFKLVYEDEDVVGRDFLNVDFGTDRVLTVDLGAGWVDWKNQFGVVRQGGIHFWVLDNPTIDLSPYMDGTTKNLTFTVINDATPNSSSSAWIRQRFDPSAARSRTRHAIRAGCRSARLRSTPPRLILGSHGCVPLHPIGLTYHLLRSLDSVNSRCPHAVVETMSTHESSREASKDAKEPMAPRDRRDQSGREGQERRESDGERGRRPTGTRSTRARRTRTSLRRGRWRSEASSQRRSRRPQDLRSRAPERPICFPVP